MGISIWIFSKHSLVRYLHYMSKKCARSIIASLIKGGPYRITPQSSVHSTKQKHARKVTNVSLHIISLKPFITQVDTRQNSALNTLEIKLSANIRNIAPLLILQKKCLHLKFIFYHRTKNSSCTISRLHGAHLISSIIRHYAYMLTIGRILDASLIYLNIWITRVLVGEQITISVHIHWDVQTMKCAPIVTVGKSCNIIRLNIRRSHAQKGCIV